MLRLAVRRHLVPAQVYRIALTASSAPRFRLFSSIDKKDKSTPVDTSPPKSTSSSVAVDHPTNKWVAALPGVAAAAAVMQASFWSADYVGKALMAAQGLAATSSPISGVPVAIIMGLLLGNLFTLPASLKPGLQLCTTTILRAGIVCVGIKLSAMDLLTLGATGVPVVIACIGAGLVGTIGLARLLGLPNKLGMLTAAGSSICGVTAIVSLAPVINASKQEVAIAVANVVAFGLFGMLVYPHVAHVLFENSTQIGVFLGTAVHDTSQVIGSALTYNQTYGDEAVLKVAAVTKLCRNIFLAAVIPGLSLLNKWTEGNQSTGGKGKSVPLVPLFVLGFIAMGAFRSLVDTALANGVDLYVVDAAGWKSFCSTVGDTVGSRYLLGTAMAGLGLSTSVAVFKGVGIRPFLLGFGGAAIVASTGLAMIFCLLPGSEAPKVEQVQVTDEQKSSKEKISSRGAS